MKKTVLIAIFSFFTISLSVTLFLLLQVTDKDINVKSYDETSILQYNTQSKQEQDGWTDKMADFQPKEYSFPVTEMNLNIELSK